jgi:hypothetical protein
MVVEGLYINKKNRNIGLGVPSKLEVAHFSEIGLLSLMGTLKKNSFNFITSELTEEDRLVVMRELVVWNDQ